MEHRRLPSAVCLLTSVAGAWWSTPDRPRRTEGTPMSTRDENLYRGDPPAAQPPPPGYGPPSGYGPPPGYPPPGYGPPPYAPSQAWGRPTNTMAILALVMAFVFAPAGLILGIIARKQIRQTGEDGDGLALAGIIVGGIVTAIFVSFIVLWVIAFAALTQGGSFGP